MTENLTDILRHFGIFDGHFRQLHLLGVVCSAALRGPAGWVQRAGVLAARLLASAAVCYAATAMLLVATVPLSSLHQPLQGLLRSELPEGVGQQVLPTSSPV